MKEITAKKLRCTFGACPAVFELDAENLVIIGTELTDELKEQIQSRVGSGEHAIVIRRELLQNLES
jgi:hypothetical protein